MKEGQIHWGQMSESVPVAILLTLSGGLQDAYTYYFRGEVFANAQTGNIILLGHSLMNADWARSIRYLLPVLAFVGGIYLSEAIKGLFLEKKWLHWRQIVVLVEIVLLFLVGFLPQSMNTAANIIVSLVCAIQVEAFRKLKGTAFASTMCIGNLRSATELLYSYRHTKDRVSLRKSLQFYGAIVIFALGACLGSAFTTWFGVRAIWCSCGLLLVCFIIMFRKEDKGERMEQFVIRKTEKKDLQAVEAIYAYARQFMREHGNPGQWGDSYPSHDMLLSDIKAGKSFVCEKDGKTVCVFYFAVETELSYGKIYEGGWLSDRPYGVVHRIASSGEVRGCASECLTWCLRQWPNIRIDTHRANLPMQSLLKKMGFAKCGILYLEDGDERIGFQKQID